MKKVYVSQSVRPNSRGRPLGRWKNRVKEYYMCERSATREGGIHQARRECLDKEEWRLFWPNHLFGGHFQSE